MLGDKQMYGCAIAMSFGALFSKIHSIKQRVVESYAELYVSALATTPPLLPLTLDSKHNTNFQI